MRPVTPNLEIILLPMVAGFAEPVGDAAIDLDAVEVVRTAGFTADCLDQNAAGAGVPDWDGWWRW